MTGSAQWGAFRLEYPQTAAAVEAGFREPIDPTATVDDVLARAVRALLTGRPQ